MKPVALDNFPPFFEQLHPSQRSLATKREIWRQKLPLVHIRPGDAQGLHLLFRYVKKINKNKKWWTQKIYEGSRREGVYSITDTDRSGSTSKGRDLSKLRNKIELTELARYADCGLYILQQRRFSLLLSGLSKSSGQCRGGMLAEVFYSEPDLKVRFARWGSDCKVEEWKTNTCNG